MKLVMCSPYSCTEPLHTVIFFMPLWARHSSLMLKLKLAMPGVYLLKLLIMALAFPKQTPCNVDIILREFLWILCVCVCVMFIPFPKASTTSRSVAPRTWPKCSKTICSEKQKSLSAGHHSSVTCTDMSQSASLQRQMTRECLYIKSSILKQ